MNTSNKKWKNVDEYIDTFSGDVQKRLIDMRALVQRCCPGAGEGISYGMPAYKLNKKPLIYFAAFDHHIGVYATPSVHELFAKQLAVYKQGKGSVQFPHNQPFPIDLIEKMLIFKINELLKK